MTLQIPKLDHRMGEIKGAPEGAPSDSREVVVSFSSEAPYERANLKDGTRFLEVLGHDEGEVDLTRLNSGAAPLLKDHMAILDAKIGVVARAWLEGGRGHALVRFSETPAADDILARVRAGDVTCVSVGYQVQTARRAADQDGQPVARVTRWIPKEISFVAIPADPSVGFGRGDHPETETVSVTEKEGTMPKDVTTTPEAKAPVTPITPKAAPAPQTRSDDDVTTAVTAERKRADEIDSISAAFDLPADLAAKAKRDGTSVDAFRNLTLDYLGSSGAEATRAGATMIGLTKKEKENFSVVRLLRHLAAPQDSRFRKEAGFELEAVVAATDSHKGQVRGVILPNDVTYHTPERTRASDQVVGTANLGGNLVDDVLLSGSMIEVLRNVSVLSQMGVRVFGGLVGDVSFPKQLTDIPAFWVPEDGSPPQGGMTFGQVKMAPKTCAAMTELSRKLLLQSSTAVESWARLSIIASIALKIDSAGLNGDADADAPSGLDDAAGVNVVDFAVDGAPTYAEIVNMRTKVKKQNALLGNLGYVLSPDIEEHLLTTPKFSGGDHPIMVDEGRLGGYRAKATNQTPANKMWFGNWSDLYMGLWSGLDIMVDPYSNSASGAVRVVAHQDVDFAVAREQSFTRGVLVP